MTTSSFGRRVRAALLAAALAAGVSPAFAQAPEAAAPAADQLNAAREVIELSGAANSLKDIVPIFFDEAKQTFSRTRPEIAKDLDEALKAIAPEFEQRRDQLMTDIALVYAQRFSAQELAEIKAFYQTPTGKKLVENLPAILQASYQQTQIWSQKMSQDIVSRLRAEMKKRGHEI
ncbi:DUF2059 domain-containing protein [Methylopila sp. M107]|uniref:DUF2059 domain-containing protein n=1 Tax=Methylopila sp. M107 TaxID=1101190 RepID=UPI00037300F4|nr:DUF2059 domain-containing protein [Methylopila sp. M107]